MHLAGARCTNYWLFTGAMAVERYRQLHPAFQKKTRCQRVIAVDEFFLMGWQGNCWLLNEGWVKAERWNTYRWQFVREDDSAPTLVQPPGPALYHRQQEGTRLIDIRMRNHTSKM